MTGDPTRTARPLRVAIAGGGVFGLSAAWRLARAGHAVTLHEAGGIPAERASSNDVSKLLRSAYGRETGRLAPLVLRARGLWRELERETGRTVYHETGTLFLAAAWEPGGFEHASHDGLRALGRPVDRLGRAEVLRRHPAFAGEGIVGALADPCSGWLDPMEALPALAEAAVASGAEVRTGSRVTDPSRLAGDRVLVCAGPWLRDLLPGLPLPVRVTRQREYLFMPADPLPLQGVPAWSFDIACAGWYGFPLHPTGVMKVARHVPGPEGHPDRVEEATPEELREAAEGAARLLPGLAGARVVARTCHYTSAPDGAFVFDRVPGSERVFVAGCGGGHAFKFGPVLGEWARDLLEQDRVPAEFRLDRSPSPRII